MTTINRATWTDDDGSGMTGTILNNARLQGDVYDKVDAALATLDGVDAGLASKNTTQDSRLTAVESTNTTQDGRLTAVENTNATQDTTLTSLQNQINALPGATQSGAKVYSNTGQGLTATTWTTLTFQAEEFDLGGFHDPAVNPSRLTVPAGAGGYYAIWAKCFCTTTSIHVRMRILKNGVICSTESRNSAVTGQTGTASDATVLQLVPGDYIEVQAYCQGGAGTIGAAARDQSSEFGLWKN